MSAERPAVTSEPTPHEPCADRRANIRVQMDKIEKMYEAVSDPSSKPVFVFPTVYELDASAQYVPGGPPTQGTASYFSYAILFEENIMEIYPSILSLGNWKILFSRVGDKDKNPKDFPIYVLDADATIQYHFCNLLSKDLLTLFVRSKQQHLARQQAEAAAKKEKEKSADN